MRTEQRQDEQTLSAVDGTTLIVWLDADGRCAGRLSAGGVGRDIGLPEIVEHCSREAAQLRRQEIDRLAHEAWQALRRRLAAWRMPRGGREPSRRCA